MDKLADIFRGSVLTIVENVNGKADELSVTAETMSAAAEQTNRQAIAVAAAAEEASQNVQNVASAAEQLAQGTAGDLTSQSASLQREVDAFLNSIKTNLARPVEPARASHDPMPRRDASIFGRRDAEDFTVRLIRQKVKVALTSLNDRPDPLAEIAEQPLLMDHTRPVQLEPHNVFGYQTAVEQTPLPLRESGAGIEEHAGGSDHRRPLIQGFFHALGRPLPRTDRRAIVINAVGHHGPAIVPAGLRKVDLIAAARTMLVDPQCSGFRMERRTLDVAVAI